MNQHFLLQFCLILTLVSVTTTIYLPISSKRPRCMMVFTIGEVQSVKIDINAPALPSQGSDQFFSLTMRNTQTQQKKNDQISSGVFKKEYDLTPNVIYEFCMLLNTGRNFDNITIYYNAETVYSIDHAQIKVPDTLLKKDDFKGTYEAAYRIGQTAKTYVDMQKEREVFANQNFEETSRVDQRLITISVVEIIIVVAAGVYQYYSLQNYLTSKQYI